MSKRRMFPISLNGNAMEPDQFGYLTKQEGPGFVPDGIDGMQFPCPGKPKHICWLRLTLGAPKDPTPDDPWRRWHWDGNMERPTITPSIGCELRCGWHGNITNGEWKP